MKEVTNILRSVQCYKEKVHFESHFKKQKQRLVQLNESFVDLDKKIRRELA